ncbi:unnamed protein product (macronuclear) [Paramecium tetraurelia]|uniref:Transmembrane protein n=1 Tax=Paramecium tetraurelia TaxID=5888 RepID=A0D1P1_PARTE|nr:uncharacterized protein GSPATT00012482001 [Paramecium tetraurelia]CAK76958.1 unnamed protein product [Paramecium tetraurelia]|eukprot:XP_001444355.1 hypothetical protein (macronuclear) [Paramecium tetraurelia strain d4-2]
MSQGNQDPQLQAEQIDIIRKKPSLKFQPVENYPKDQIEIQSVKNNKLEPIFFQDPRVEDKHCLLEIIVVKQIESKQLAKSQTRYLFDIIQNSFVSLTGRSVFIYSNCNQTTRLKQIYYYLIYNSHFDHNIVTNKYFTMSSLLWILSVAIGTIGIRRQKYNPLIFYFLGIFVSFTIEFSSTIVILATNHIADHQLGIYNKNGLVRLQ